MLIFFKVVSMGVCKNFVEGVKPKKDNPPPPPPGAPNRGGVAAPPEFWMGVENMLTPLILRRFLLGVVAVPLKLIKLYSICIFIYIEILIIGIFIA